MASSTTQRGPRFLQFARTLTLVSGLSLTACGGAVEASPADGGDYDGAPLGVHPYDGSPVGTAPPPYDGGWTGTDVSPPYDGVATGTSPPPYDGGPTGVTDVAPDDGYDSFSMGTLPPVDGGIADTEGAETAPDDPGADALPGGPLSPPELPSEMGLA